MIALAAAVVAIALPDSLNPSLIGAAVYLALGPHPFRRTLVFTLAASVVTLLGGAAIVLGLADLIIGLLPKPSRTVTWALLTAAGVLLIASGAAIWWRRRALAYSVPPSKRESAGGGSAVVMGAGIAVVELFTAFPYFAALAMIAGASVPTVGKVALIVLYNVVYSLPLIAIVIACGLWGHRGGELLAPIGDWIALRWPVVVAPLAAGAGAGLATVSILQLA